jgi:hypothetical protein
MHSSGPPQTLSQDQIQGLLTEGGQPGRSRALGWGLEEANLALEVARAKNSIAEITEMARITGLPIGKVPVRAQVIDACLALVGRVWLSRDLCLQMARVTSLLLKHTTQSGYVINTSTEGLLDRNPLNQSAMLLDPMPLSEENPTGIDTSGLHR